MTFTTLVTHVEPANAASVDASLVAPFALAEAYSAHLTALVFPAETEAAATPGQGPALAEEQAASRVQDAAGRRGLSCEVRSRSSFAHGVGEVFVDHLRIADLGILTLGETFGTGHRILQDAAIFDSGRPLLLLPQARPLSTPPARIVIAWDATPAAVRAVHAALPLIRRATETLVVTITDDKDMRPGQSGIGLTHLIARHGGTARFVGLRHGSAGVMATMLGAAREAGAEMLVMGALRHSALRNLVVGSATRDVLEHGPRLATLLAA